MMLRLNKLSTKYHRDKRAGTMSLDVKGHPAMLTQTFAMDAGVASKPPPAIGTAIGIRAASIVNNTPQANSFSNYNASKTISFSPHESKMKTDIADLDDNDACRNSLFLLSPDRRPLGVLVLDSNDSNLTRTDQFTTPMKKQHVSEETMYSDPNKKLQVKLRKCKRRREKGSNDEKLPPQSSSRRVSIQ